jgi:Fis family transcriptional regulator
MTRAQPLIQAPGISSGEPSTGHTDNEQESFKHGDSLRDAVTIAVGHYLKELDGQMPTGVYPMVLAEMEAPLLAQIMAYTRNNQTKASIMLGLNRGTLRKKLKQYKLIPSDQD